MPFADLAGVKLHYRFDGDESLPVLVLSNSLGTSLDMWQPQIAALTQRFRVLRYDTRGHGQSSVTEGPYSIAQLGGDVIALLDHLGLQRVHFCGLSMGGITGMWLGVHHADRLDKLILCNTAAYIGPPENWTNRAAAVERDGVASIAAAVVDKWLTPDFAAQQADLVQTLRTMLGATDARGYAANCLAVRDSDLRNDVQRITTPTLVIAGTGDIPTPPADGRYLAENIPGARYVELYAAHLSNLQQVEGFNQAVLAFLDR
ncbi:3-oxoadipate enol-lactonase [Cupriavidus sp. OV038]|jgi:3-oxoadipate enol-lactonase|uniref:3-oxoadipate enol-lactonase n=1 Tax=unclassified Cupriavidus TaxID=2640874 RepID=UPI0008E9C13E|nr:MULTISPECIES: 3-oxoadipate enol-lactonase [unclassified Cupriavidus]SFD22050.1 3-oxoadipate enol-lactonase [Cupriavidus sp. OV038]SFP91398.1 3-oxoadipate enol-lactonase [Cupriavidus sp. OV096]